MRNNRVVAFYAGLLMLAGVAFAAQGSSQAVYKWVDAKGHTHYSDKAPVDQAFQRMDVLPGLNLLPSEALEDFPPQLQRTKIKSQPVAILLQPDGGSGKAAAAQGDTLSEYTRYSYLPLQYRARRCTGVHCRLKPRIPKKYRHHKPYYPAKQPNYSHIKPVGFNSAGRQRLCGYNCKPVKPPLARNVIR